MKMRAYPFRTRLLLLFITSILVPTLLFAALLSAYFADMLLENDRSAYQNTLRSVSMNLQNYMDDLMRFAYAPNTYFDVLDAYNYINSGEYDTIPNALRYNQVNSHYRTTMQTLFNITRSEVLGAVFIPSNNPLGQEYIVDRNESTLRPIPCDIPDDWLTAATAGNGRPVFSPAHTVNYYGDDGTGVFSLLCLVKDVDAGKNIGVMKADISATAVQEVFTGIETSAHSSFLLLDQADNVIYETHPLNIPPAKLTDGASLRSGGGLYHVYLTTIPQSDWRLAYLASDADIRGQTDSIYLLALLLAACCLGSAWLIFSPRSKRMVKPMGDIITTLEHVEKGDLTVRAHPDPRAPDFYKIASALNRTIERLSGYIDREYKSVLARRNAEYLTLQTQINPHFLYNTLNGFIALNRMGERQALEDSIIQMTRMFRYTCSKTGDSTIGQEFAFLREYLFLQQLRFEERLQYKVTATPETENVSIPKLLVQPLVENAVLHGMEDCPHPVCVDVSARREENDGHACVVITVRDNGVGFDTSAAPAEKRVGLRNVQERLDLFAPGSTFAIESKPGEYTLCTLRFFPDSTTMEVTHENLIGG